MSAAGEGAPLADGHPAVEAYNPEYWRAATAAARRAATPALTPRGATCGTAALPWPGGKTWLAKTLIAKLPPHECYVEVFGGSGALLFAKPPSRTEVYNDVNGDLVNVFRCLKYHEGEMRRELALLLNSREEFAAAIAQPGLTDIQRAARWWWRHKVGFGGHAGRGDAGFCAKSGRAMASSRAIRDRAIERLSARLDRTQIERLDWRELLAKYDRPATVFFIDPPYDTTAKEYGIGFSNADRADLKPRLNALRGWWIATLPDELWAWEWAEGHPVEVYERPLTRNNTTAGKRRKYRELLILKDFPVNPETGTTPTP